MREIIQQVRLANPQRDSASLGRRCWKLIEELGEVAETYLNVTSARNVKAKTWDDLREELADVLIVALDIALTPLPAATPPLSAAFEATLLRSCKPARDISHLDTLGVELAAQLAKFKRRLDARLDTRLDAPPPREAAAMARAMALTAFEMALLRFPDAPAVADELDILRREVARKLAKWAASSAVAGREAGVA